MKRFLPILLVFFSFALCVLSAFQWVRETHLRNGIARLHNGLFQQTNEIQNLQGLLKTIQMEATRLDSLKTELIESQKTNRDEAAILKRVIETTKSEVERNLRQIDEYKRALEKSKAILEKQNGDIQKQNTEMKQLAADRNEVVTKYNRLVEEYKELAKDFKKYQEDAAKALGDRQPGGKPPAEKSLK